MAVLSPLSNFLNFLLPTKPPPPPSTALPPPQLNLPSPPSTPFPSQTLKSPPPHNSVPLVSSSSSSSSCCDELSSVICPSLAYSNTLFFRSPYNVQVVVGEDEGEERLLNRFRREVMRAGVIQESKRRRYFENKQEEKKRKSREAAKRNSRRRRPLLKAFAQNKLDVPTTKKEEDEDNWDLPEGDSPY